MSAFTDFVQTELPLRPYLAADVAANSVIVRQGAGPRQLSGIQLSAGEILMNIDGTLQAVLLDDVAGNADTFVHVQESAATTWVIAHNMNSELYIVQIFDENGKVIVPDDVETTDANTVTIVFNSTPTLGRAVFSVVRE
ncbi:hypothetical protein BN7874_199 [Phage NCTB]|nr:hypothetical protein BN7874_199 [Phage NCTB]